MGGYLEQKSNQASGYVNKKANQGVDWVVNQATGNAANKVNDAADGIAGAVAGKKFVDQRPKLAPFVSLKSIGEKGILKPQLQADNTSAWFGLGAAKQALEQAKANDMAREASIASLLANRAPTMSGAREAMAMSGLKNMLQSQQAQAAKNAMERMNLGVQAAQKAQDLGMANTDIANKANIFNASSAVQDQRNRNFYEQGAAGEIAKLAAANAQANAMSRNAGGKK